MAKIKPTTPEGLSFAQKCDEITEAIRHLHDCRMCLAEVYAQVGKQAPDGVDSYLWARVAGLVGEDG